MAAVLLILRAGTLGRRAAAALAGTAVVIALAAPAASTLSAVASAQPGQPERRPGDGVTPRAWRYGRRDVRFPVAAERRRRGRRPGWRDAVSGTAVSGTAATALAVNASRYTWIVATSSAQMLAGSSWRPASR